MKVRQLSENEPGQDPPTLWTGAVLVAVVALAAAVMCRKSRQVT
jgi:hypothetical protein